MAGQAHTVIMDAVGNPKPQCENSAGWGGTGEARQRERLAYGRRFEGSMARGSLIQRGKKHKSSPPSKSLNLRCADGLAAGGNTWPSPTQHWHRQRHTGRERDKHETTGNIGNHTETKKQTAKSWHTHFDFMAQFQKRKKTKMWPVETTCSSIIYKGRNYICIAKEMKCPSRKNMALITATCWCKKPTAWATRHRKQVSQTTAHYGPCHHMHNTFSPLFLFLHVDQLLWGLSRSMRKNAISSPKIIYEQRHGGSQLAELCKDLKMLL